MSEEWEYVIEETEARSQQNYLNSCPVICRNCRWLDVYYRFGCTQLAYPDAADRCILYTHQANYRRFKWFGVDMHHRFWQARVWFQEKVLRQRRNHVGSWRQWELDEDVDHGWDVEDSDGYDEPFGFDPDEDYSDDDWEE